MHLFNTPQIQSALDVERDLHTLIELQKQAFREFSAGLYEIPLPLQLAFPEHAGECHVKAGFRINDDFFVIKIAGGFLNKDLPSHDGLIVIASQKTGTVRAILHDGGWLTLLRTAIAGLIAAEITPWNIHNIGIIGTGKVAHLTHTLIKKRHPQATVHLWGRNPIKARCMTSDETLICDNLHTLFSRSDIVISATASRKALIKNSDITGRAHLIALGADSIHKQECDPLLFQRSDAIIIDSKAQARHFGDSFHALKAGLIAETDTIELGDILKSPEKLIGAELIITDLTGSAAQDAALTQFALQKLTTSPEMASLRP